MVQPIIVFDSGVGGLSIYQQIKQLLPRLPVIYCADTAGFPYGAKSETEVVQRTSSLLKQLSQHYNPALVVIACNTASTITLPTVRAQLPCPVVGVVPAIKTASLYSKNRCIGLLATPGTVRRAYTDQLIERFARDCDVIRVGSAELAQLAENHLRGLPVSQQKLRSIMMPFFAGDKMSDAIVLGCTHFPLLVDLLDQVIPQPVQWIDSGAAIARRVHSLLLLQNYEFKALSQGDLFLYSGDAESVQGLEAVLTAMGFIAVRQLPANQKTCKVAVTLNAVMFNELSL